MVPAALRALAYAFTAATAEPTDVLLNWHSIVEVRGSSLGQNGALLVPVKYMDACMLRLQTG